MVHHTKKEVERWIFSTPYEREDEPKEGRVKTLVINLYNPVPLNIVEIL
jgi:hypothetical protein